MTCGSFCAIPYDPSAPDHVVRSHKVFMGASGIERITDFFDVILPKVSCLNPSLRSTLFKKLRIPKFQR